MSARILNGGVKRTQRTYSEVSADIRASLYRERSRWSRRADRAAAVTVPRLPSLPPDPSLSSNNAPREVYLRRLGDSSDLR